MHRAHTSELQYNSSLVQIVVLLLLFVTAREWLESLKSKRHSNICQTMRNNNTDLTSGLSFATFKKKQFFLSIAYYSVYSLAAFSFCTLLNSLSTHLNIKNALLCTLHMCLYYQLYLFPTFLCNCYILVLA